jgi:hypothetical protein
MNSIIYVVLILISITLTALPILKKILSSLGLDINGKEFDLLRKIVEDAVAHVNQMALNEEITSSQKKEMAIRVATKLAERFGIDASRFDVISDLIESILWHEEEPTDDDDDDDDDDD